MFRFGDFFVWATVQTTNGNIKIITQPAFDVAAMTQLFLGRDEDNPGTGIITILQSPFAADDLDSGNIFQCHQIKMNPTIMGKPVINGSAVLSIYFFSGMIIFCLTRKQFYPMPGSG